MQQWEFHGIWVRMWWYLIGCLLICQIKPHPHRFRILNYHSFIADNALLYLKSPFAQKCLCMSFHLDIWPPLNRLMYVQSLTLQGYSHIRLLKGESVCALTLSLSLRCICAKRFLTSKLVWKAKLSYETYRNVMWSWKYLLSCS